MSLVLFGHLVTMTVYLGKLYSIPILYEKSLRLIKVELTMLDDPIRQQWNQASKPGNPTT